MHRAALVLLIVLAPAIVVAQPAPPMSPPSKTLERAIKLYDVQDFFSATIEAKKVLDGQSGDSPENVERARFFMAKSLFQLELYVPSFVMFQQIIQANGMYRSASFKWIAALRTHIPDAMLAPAIATMTPQELDEPVIAQKRDDLFAIQNAKAAPATDLHAVARDALGCTHPDPARMRELVEKILSLDDNVEIAEYTRRVVRGDDALAQTLDLAMHQAPTTRDSLAWVAELRAELELLQRSDKAWQTTMVAAEILQEVTVQHSVGEADFGARMHQLLDAMLPEIAGSASYSTPADRCTRGGAPTLAGTPSTAPMVVDPPRSGCGCSTGGSPKDGALLVALLALVLRRRSRAASGTRSPRA